MGRARKNKERDEGTEKQRVFNEVRSFLLHKLIACETRGLRIGAIDFDGSTVEEKKRKEKKRKEKKVFLTKSIVKRSWNEREFFFMRQKNTPVPSKAS